MSAWLQDNRPPPKQIQAPSHNSAKPNLSGNLRGLTHQMSTQFEFFKIGRMTWQVSFQMMTLSHDKHWQLAGTALTSPGKKAGRCGSCLINCSHN